VVGEDGGRTGEECCRAGEDGSRTDADPRAPRDDGRDRLKLTCPDCGSAGTAVATVTLKSLLVPDALERLDPGAPYFYCGTPDCPVVYFTPGARAGRSFVAGEVKVPVFAKAPIDVIGTGSYLPDRWMETYATADVVAYDNVASVKVGREFLLKK